jgi:hypothetical protein
VAVIGEGTCNGVTARVGYLDPSMDSIAAILVGNDSKGRRVHGVFDDGALRFEPHDEKGRVPHLFRMDGVMLPPFAPDVLRALGDATNHFLGERPEMSELRGRLEAQERHLEDIRALLWKGPKP